MTAAFDTLAAAIRSGQGELATGADLTALRTATQADLAALEVRLTWRIVGLIVAT